MEKKYFVAYMGCSWQVFDSENWGMYDFDNENGQFDTEAEAQEWADQLND